MNRRIFLVLHESSKSIFAEFQEACEKANINGCIHAGVLSL